MCKAQAYRALTRLPTNLGLCLSEVATPVRLPRRMEFRRCPQKLDFFRATPMSRVCTHTSTVLIRPSLMFATCRYGRTRCASLVVETVEIREC
jgi:hypothetical protein